jgi:hypothetical protein
MFIPSLDRKNDFYLGCLYSVMGIFPILMNIIQFWLIDSIVKASSMAAVALDIEQGTRHDSEPLFQGNSEDEDDFDPRPNTNHRSSSLSDARRLDTSDDRSFDTNTSEILITKESINSHSYPPSLSGSISSNVASSLDPKSPKVKNLVKQGNRRMAGTSSESSHLSGSSSLPRTPLQATHVHQVTESADWAESWDDADEWDHPKKDSLGMERIEAE